VNIGSDTVGPNARVERVLADYGLDADGLADDLVQSDEVRLQLARLLEARGEDSIIDAEVSAAQSEDDQPENPEYISGSVETEADPEPLKLDFSASAVIVRRIDSPIWVAFRPPESAQYKMQIDPGQDETPFVLSPPGLSVTRIWVGRPEGTDNTSVMIDALD
jgi:hypothetical protein